MKKVQGNKNIQIVTKIMEANDRIADENRQRFAEHGLFVVDIMGSPGSGKTSLLETTIPNLLKKQLKVGVIVGDIMTTNDAERISVFSIPVIQIMTESFGGACHLNASMIRQALDQLNLEDMDILFIENVGNLVCPAEFDIGHNERVVLISVTEGEDKPAKYPLAFRIADLVILTKTDLLPYLDFDINIFYKNLKWVNPKTQVFDLSAKKEKNLQNWINWLEQKIKKTGDR
ncbi:MAG: hydrogenase accessory protein HypB [Candidatus Schekmanbacteria bacterium RBG_13_48_7]|uniref:Hydrogenase accessory protein HypB n=1 Tax=Candidatus Schekmanbacteria bacterium RBG_13_48_7 TaxID=1817878 RepID=A0A1F7RVT6_9BACT|nr:MAG: hydrogenase accessory protein HypB [Candidatus Schekmanbacteria bacterium RBG_13_48_7]